jgi:hypothetical protein
MALLQPNDTNAQEIQATQTVSPRITQPTFTPQNQGNLVGGSAAQAPRVTYQETSISPQNAAFSDMVDAKLFDQVGAALDNYEKVSTVKESHDLQTHKVELNLAAERIRSDMQQEELTTGKRLTSDQSESQFRDRYASVQNELNSKYKYNFTNSDAKEELDLVVNDNYQTHKAKFSYPRLAMEVVEGTQTQLASLKEQSDLRFQQGDKAGALSLITQNADKMYDPRYQVASGLSSIELVQKKQEWVDEQVKNLMLQMSAEEQLHYIDTARQSNVSEDPLIRQANPLRGVSPKMVDALWKNADSARDEEIRESKAIAAEKQHLVDAKFAEDHDNKIDNFKAKLDSKGLRTYKFQLEQEIDSALKNGGISDSGHSYDALARIKDNVRSTQDQVSNQIQANQEKAAREREKQLEKMERRRLASMYASNSLAVDVTDSDSKKLAEEGFAATVSGITDPKQMWIKTKEYATRKQYIPHDAKVRVNSMINSADPNQQKIGIQMLDELTKDPRNKTLLEQFPKDVQNTYYDVTTSGMTVEQSMKRQQKVAANPEQYKYYEAQGKKVVGDKTFNWEDAGVKSGVSGSKEVQRVYSQKFAEAYADSHGDQTKAKAIALDYVKRNYDVSKSSGKNGYYAVKPPSTFGVVADLSDEYVDSVLQSVPLPLKDAATVSGRDPVSGRLTDMTPYKLEFVSTDSRGNPAYKVLIPDGRGDWKYVQQSSKNGHVEDSVVTMDPSKKIAYPSRDAMGSPEQRMKAPYESMEQYAKRMTSGGNY